MQFVGVLLFDFYPCLGSLFVQFATLDRSRGFVFVWTSYFAQINYSTFLLQEAHLNCCWCYCKYLNFAKFRLDWPYFECLRSKTGHQSACFGTGCSSTFLGHSNPTQVLCFGREIA